MIKIYADQIFLYINEIQSFQYSYILFGSSNILLQDSKDFILKNMNDQELIDRYHLQSNTEIDWIQLKNFIKNYSMFSKKKIIIFHFLDNTIRKRELDNIKKLVSLLHENIILIIIGNESVKNTLKYDCFSKLLKKYLMVINCSIINKRRMLEWIKNKAKFMGVLLKEDICKFIYYLCERNILELSQLIMNLSLIYPGKELHIENITELSKKYTSFLPIQLVNSMIKGNLERSLEIIQKISHNKIIEPIFLLRIIQKQIFLLISLIKKVPKMNKDSMFVNTYKKKDITISNALKSISIQQLYKSINIMKIIEYSIKKNSKIYIWTHFYTLALTICKRNNYM